MDYIREYKKFIGGYNFGHGLQTTFCIVSPTVAGFYLDLLTPGILISLGAICVSSIDTPGPPKHRRNGLLLGAGCVMLSALAMSSYVLNEWLGNFIILSLVFSLSMIAVYGIRVTNIGLAGIYTLVLITESKNDFHTYLTHAGLFFAGDPSRRRRRLDPQHRHHQRTQPRQRSRHQNRRRNRHSDPDLDPVLDQDCGPERERRRR